MPLLRQRSHGATSASRRRDAAANSRAPRSTPLSSQRACRGRPSSRTSSTMTLTAPHDAWKDSTQRRLGRLSQRTAFRWPASDRADPVARSATRSPLRQAHGVGCAAEFALTSPSHFPCSALIVSPKRGAVRSFTGLSPHVRAAKWVISTMSGSTHSDPRSQLSRQTRVSSGVRVASGTIPRRPIPLSIFSHVVTFNSGQTPSSASSATPAHVGARRAATPESRARPRRPVASGGAPPTMSGLSILRTSPRCSPACTRRHQPRGRGVRLAATSAKTAWP